MSFLKDQVGFMIYWQYFKFNIAMEYYFNFHSHLFIHHYYHFHFLFEAYLIVYYYLKTFSPLNYISRFVISNYQLIIFIYLFLLQIIQFLGYFFNF